MKIIFLGTGAAFPSAAKGSSSLIFQLNSGHSWIFDSGEGTQIQLQKLPTNVSWRKISKIFITHLHGDHVFGLPGLLCTISMNLSLDLAEDKHIIDLYGPLGLRRFLNTALAIACSPLCFNYRVHELKPVSCQYPEDFLDAFHLDNSVAVPNHPNEAPGRIIEALEIDDNYSWEIINNEEFKIEAGIIIHKIPTFGYIIREKDRPGHLLVEKLQLLGIPKGPLYGKLKSGSSITLEDGTLVNPDEVLGDPITGKTVVICGDTQDASPIVQIAKHCDVLVHEATHDDSLKEKCISHGHSTPSMAAGIAASLQAKMLLLNHFSHRYRHTKTEDNQKETVGTLEEQARSALSGTKTKVLAADDFFIYDFKDLN